MSAGAERSTKGKSARRGTQSPSERKESRSCRKMMSSRNSSVTSDKMKEEVPGASQIPQKNSSKEDTESWVKEGESAYPQQHPDEKNLESELERENEKLKKELSNLIRLYHPLASTAGPVSHDVACLLGLRGLMLTAEAYDPTENENAASTGDPNCDENLLVMFENLFGEPLRDLLASSHPPPN